jgi:chromosome segregation ATPase
MNFPKNVKYKITQNPLDALKFGGAVILVAAILTYAFTTFSSSPNELTVQNDLLIKDIQQKNSEYLASIDARDKEIEDLKKDVVKLQENLVKKENLLNSKGIQIDAKEGNIDGMAKQIKSLEEDKDNLLEIISSKTKNIEAITDRNKEQNEIIKSTQVQLDKAQTQSSEMQKDLKVAQSDLKSLTEKYTILSTSKDKLQTQNIDLVGELSKTKTELNDNKIALSDAHTEVKILKELRPIVNQQNGFGQYQNGNQQQGQQYLQNANSSSPITNTDTLKIVAILSVIVMFIIFVVYMLQN